MVTSKLELLVEWGTDGPGDVSERTLKKLQSMNGVQHAEIKDGAILVETTLPSSVLMKEVEDMSGRRVVLQGFGEKQSAVVQVSGERGAIGVVRLQQTRDAGAGDAGGAPLVVDGTVDGLAPGQHALRVHAAGDLSQGCESLGEIYGGAGGTGEIGVVTADDTGRAVFRILHESLQISEIIGRSLAISASPMEIKNGSTNNINWSELKNVGCGIIARSAGVLTNPKRVCACDGVVVWDERDRPAAGKARRKPCCGKHSNL